MKHCKCANNGPCPFALERIHAMQAEVQISKGGNLDVTTGCDWYINSAEYNYNFKNMLRDLHGSPMTDKEICQLLVITPSQLKEIFNSAIQKLSARKDSPEIMALVEIVAERRLSEDSDNTIYMPDSFKEKLNSDAPEDTEAAEEEKPAKKGRKKIKNSYGMPVHRSGEKVDLWGLYSKKGLENNRNAKKNKK